MEPILFLLLVIVIIAVIRSNHSVTRRLDKIQDGQSRLTTRLNRLLMNLTHSPEHPEPMDGKAPATAPQALTPVKQQPEPPAETEPPQEPPVKITPAEPELPITIPDPPPIEIIPEPPEPVSAIAVSESASPLSPQNTMSSSDLPGGSHPELPAKSPLKPGRDERTADPSETVGPSQLVETVREIFIKIWNWILVGEEHRPTGVTAEYAIASTWLLRVGIAAIVMCVAYFLKWSIDRELLGPAARVALSMITGLGMVISGMRLIRTKYHMIGQGLMGGGILVLYFSVFAASSLYALIGLPLAFALMILVTVTAGFLAVRTNAMLIAILGIAGGFLTPVILHAPTLSLPGLYSYMLLLSFGILGIAHYRQWRLLNYLGFFFTYALFFQSLQSYRSEDFPFAMSFLTALFVVHASIVYIHNVVRGKPSGTMDILHLTGNALIFALTGYGLINHEFGRPYPAILSVGLAIFFIAHAMVFLRKKQVDRNMSITLIALAGAFTAWTLPLIFDGGSLTIAMAILALTFLWTGLKMGSQFLQHLAYGLYAVIGYRLLFMEMPGYFRYVPHAFQEDFGYYWRHMLPRFWTFGTAIASMIGAHFLQGRAGLTAPARLIAPENDIPEWIGTTVIRRLFYGTGAALVFIFIYLEFNTMLTCFQPLRLPVLSILWCGLAVWLLNRCRKSAKPTKFLLWGIQTVLLVVIAKLVLFDIGTWQLNDHFVYMTPYSFLTATMRFIDFGFIIGTCLIIWKAFERNPWQTRSPRIFAWTGAIIFFLYATFEINSLLYWQLPEFQRGGVSVLWAIFAISLIGNGIWKNLRPVRITGLALFTVVSFKIFFWDMSHMPMIYRVLAFLIVGITLMLGSFAYIHSSRKFQHDDGSNKDLSSGGPVT